MWILFSIIAAMLWAIVNVIDKRLMSKYLTRPFLPLIFAGFFALISGLIILIIIPDTLSGWALIGSVATGIIAILGDFCYFKATRE